MSQLKVAIHAYNPEITWSRPSVGDHLRRSLGIFQIAQHGGEPSRGQSERFRLLSLPRVPGPVTAVSFTGWVDRMSNLRNYIRGVLNGCTFRGTCARSRSRRRRPFPRGSGGGQFCSDPGRSTPLASGEMLNRSQELPHHARMVTTASYRYDLHQVRKCERRLNSRAAEMEVLDQTSGCHFLISLIIRPARQEGIDRGRSLPEDERSNGLSCTLQLFSHSNEGCRLLFRSGMTRLTGCGLLFNTLSSRMAGCSSRK
jgi:hypothetical protein